LAIASASVVGTPAFGPAPMQVAMPISQRPVRASSARRIRETSERFTRATSATSRNSTPRSFVFSSAASTASTVSVQASGTTSRIGRFGSGVPWR
jgi:hypothetical protein